MRTAWTAMVLGILCNTMLAEAPAASAGDDLGPLIGPEALAKIEAALPAQAAVKPASARRVLVFTESVKDHETARKSPGMKFVPHESAAAAARAVALMGAKTGAYEAAVSSDPAVFTADGLKGYDAIVLACVYLEGKLYRVPRDLKDADRAAYEARRKALLEFVRGGKGLAGLHSATAEALGWPEYNRMIGGTHRGIAWYMHQDVPVKLDDPASPLNAAFGGQGFTIQDDIDLLGDPYARDQVHVLLAVDAAKAPAGMTAERADGDYPVSWVRAEGQGRVFVTTLGHNPATFQGTAFLKHLLAGIQFAAGDLKADTSPGRPLPAKAGFTTMAGWTPLFDGKDLSAWQVSDQQKEHWVVDGGIIRYDGQARSLLTKESFKDYMLRVDWRLPRKADSGVFVRGNQQLNIWTWAMGSGEMWGLRQGFKGPPEENPYTPKSCEDRAVGEWNTFLITVKNNRVTVVLNGKEVIREAELKGGPAESPIGLQQHGDPIEYKSIYIKRLAAEAK
jgi:hypothetical protein